MPALLHKTIALTLTSLLGLAGMTAGAGAQIFTVSPNSPTGSYLAGNMALDDLDAERAARYFLMASETDWENPVVRSRAFLANLLAGDVADAAALAQRIVSEDPQDELARLTLGTVALKQRRFASADQILGRIPEASLIGITGGILRAWAQLGDGDAARANASLDRLEDEGFGEFLIFHRAIIADIAGDRETAIALAREAYELDPQVARIVEAYVRMLGNAGRFDEALAVLDETAAQGVDHPYLNALRPAIEAGRKPGLFASNVQSGAAEMFLGIGAALARDGSTELGIVFLQLALYLDPNAASVAMSLGELLTAAERYGEAAAAFEAVPANSPLRTSVLVRLAENLDLQGEREQAITRLRNILVQYPGNIEALGVLGDILRYDQQWTEAADVYTRLIEHIDGNRPRDWRYYYVRGIVLERAGEWEQAEPDFLKALELNPEHPHVLNYLGYSWVDQGLHLEEALAMIERAVELLPRDGYIIDSLGWAFYKLGRIDEALVELERAVQLLPDDPELNDHLGDVYWVAGRQREAMFQWRIAIDVDQEGKVTERATPKLLNGLDVNAPIGD